MQRVRNKPEREPTIALINIVFLMLIFFLVAGTIARPLDRDLKLVRTADLEGRSPADALVIHEDGRMSFRGRDVVSARAHMAGLDEGARTLVRLVPDRNLAAQTLVSIGRALREAGAEKVVVVTERGLE